MGETTNARLYDADLDRIHDRKGRGESVADVVHDALDALDDDVEQDGSDAKPASTA